MAEDYIFYSKKAGLDFDRYIALHPEYDGEAVFNAYKERYDGYMRGRTDIVEKYDKKYAAANNATEVTAIRAEKAYALAQFELSYIDVIKVLLGLDPKDSTMAFGETKETRYSDLVKEYISTDKPGFYIGADGLYRLAYFYESDSIPAKHLLEWYALGDKVYKNNTPMDPEVIVVVEGNVVRVPKNFYLKLLEFISENDQEKN